MSVAMAERVFRWSDDVQFEYPDDPTVRPRLIGGHTSPASGPASGPVYQRSERNYSWMAMFTPAQAGQTVISIIVFHKRDMTLPTLAPAPSERVVEIVLLGGGDVTLRAVTAAASAANEEEALEMLNVRPNQWIMLCGNVAPSGDPAIYVYRWYRILSKSDVYEFPASSGDWQLDATLAGPDIGTAAGFTGTAYAVICDGVVGVFEKTVKLDEPSYWSTH
jgi:hypothetical protein